jgi:hypothetical protein
VKMNCLAKYKNNIICLLIILFSFFIAIYLQYKSDSISNDNQDTSIGFLVLISVLNVLATLASTFVTIGIWFIVFQLLPNRYKGLLMTVQDGNTNFKKVKFHPSFLIDTSNQIGLKRARKKLRRFALLQSFISLVFMTIVYQQRVTQKEILVISILTIFYRFLSTSLFIAIWYLVKLHMPNDIISSLDTLRRGGNQNVKMEDCVIDIDLNRVTKIENVQSSKEKTKKIEYENNQNNIDDLII